ncbi:MAG: DMT family transporter [Pseudomonadota bacterium]
MPKPLLFLAPFSKNAWSRSSMSQASLSLAPLVFVVIFATGFVGARLAMPYSEPATFLMVRFAITLVLLTIIAWLSRAVWPRGITFAWLLLIGAMLHGLYLWSVFWVIDRGMPAGISAVIIGLQPITTAVFAASFLGDRITQGQRLGLAGGFVGVVMVLWPGFDWQSGGITILTIALATFGMVMLSGSTVLQKALGQTTDVRTGTAVQYIGALIPVTAFSFLFETQAIVWSGEMIFAMVWAVLVLSIAAIYLLMWLIKQGSVAQVAGYFYLIPTFAALFSFALFGESLSLFQMAGMALCALSVALASGTIRLSSRRPSPETIE